MYTEEQKITDIEIVQRKIRQLVTAEQIKINSNDSVHFSDYVTDYFNVSNEENEPKVRENFELSDV